jgi:hypothetical protein
MDAGAARIEGHAVVAAFDVVAFDAAHRERRMAVTAAVIERYRAAVGGAV